MALFDIFSAVTKSPAKSRPAKNRVVGIDIGSSSIKVVELENRSDVLTLTTYGELELGPYSEQSPLGQAVVLPANIERQALVDILRESAVHAKSAVFAMPLTSSFVTIMPVAAEANQDISSRIRVEARKYIPIPIADVTLDWAEIENNSDTNSNNRDVLLAAIQNDSLARFNNLLNTVELYNTPIEIECFSLIRGAISSSDSDCAVIDMGATGTKLYIVRNGLLQRMYRVRAGGSQLTEKIAQELTCSFEEAELLKRSITAADDRFASIQKNHRLIHDRILKEFKQVIAEYEKNLQIELSTIYLAGGGAQFQGVENYIATTFDKKVQVALPFNKVAYPAFMEDTMNTIGSSFAVALGAAMRHFE